MSPEEQNRSNLWVDKYAPKHFTDLLSDDGVNRNILFWLKLWDTVVFGKEKKQRSKPQESKNTQTKKFNPNFKKPNTEDLNDELDEHNRPVHPIALLCGPPGLGKTTLAHVIADQAGYNALEINASDDRSLDVFRTRIESATQMKSVLIKDQRPNCLIIDEIDGAPGPTINFLVNLAKQGDAKAGGTKKKKKLQLLQRPIICICNDLYVPALRPLRQVSYISHFPPTVSARLASRMLQISKENSLRTDMTTLMALASKADNDIRSCLNTLQFLHRQGRSVNLSMIHSLNVGQKDQHKGLFVTWQEIFQLPRPKRKQYTNPHDIEAGRASLPQKDRAIDANPASFSARFHRILSLAMTCGEYAKLMQGVFENYLEVKFKDPHLDSITLASDWMIFFDLLNTRVMESQNYIFNRYMPFIPVMFHMLFASVSRPQIKYPSADFESRQRQQKITNHLATMLADACPRVKKTLDVTLAVEEVIPLLQIIISPMFRPVSTQLFSMQEKKQLAELVDIMISFSLTYQQERNKEGQYNYVIDPNLDDITRFSDTPTSRQMTYGAKQLIAREIEVEKLRRREQALTTPAKPNQMSKRFCT
ncbi:Chromosome transmission fidelity protein 18-like [Holothuria leucospilota]|uniref:Chromosome transmission fidelity protein 18-like n=1 Tax=Holothuria leucospilota TaxID=206669 RepID=A0A9Q1H7R2_HOLLE|nr:Chromosome transmission fidelity protein 18-like [Holothuria leucospilota]